MLKPLKKTKLDNIVSSFSKTADQLDSLRAANEKEIDDHNNDIDAKKFTIGVLTSENERASKIHSNIKKILEA